MTATPVKMGMGRCEMTVSRVEWQKMQQRVERLEIDIAWLRKSLSPDVVPDSLDDPARWSGEQLLAYLQSQGVRIARPTSKMRERARRWRALPEAEKQAHRDLMDNLHPRPSLSEIILQNRR